MQISDAILIRAPARRVYDLAADVERWPALLPHYRWVRLLEARGQTKLVEMACWRGRLPLRWTALVEPRPEVPRLRFLHVRGVTRGMEVAWEFLPREGGTEVRIDHRLGLGWPLVGPAVAEAIIGPHFISPVAGRTLRRMRELAEAAGGG